MSLGIEVGIICFSGDSNKGIVGFSSTFRCKVKLTVTAPLDGTLIVLAAGRNLILKKY